MKKEITIEQSFCDFCGQKATGYSQCHSCGKELCYKCLDTDTKEYKCGVYFSSSHDGLFCLACNTKLIQDGDELMRAYRLIESLRNEEAGWYAGFKKRKDVAEEEVKRLFEKRQEK